MTENKNAAPALERRNGKGAGKNVCPTISIVHAVGRIVNLLLVLEVAAGCAMATAWWVLPAAWAERGYRGGIGGEWLLILLAGVAGGWLTARALARAAERGYIDGED